MIPGTEYELVNTLDGMPFLGAADDAGSLPEKYLFVRVDEQSYMLPIASVIEIVQPLPVSALPGAPSWISGLVNFRGEIAAVLNIKSLFGMPGPMADSTGQLVILNWTEDGIRIALKVDQVLDPAEHAQEDAWVIELSKLRSMLEAGLE